MNTTEKRAKDPLRGRRYIAYARCASPEDAERQLQDQVRRIQEFGDGRDMKCVGEVRLAGVNGCVPVMRPDLRELLDRKRQRDDYDVLIMVDYARLTRARPESSLEIENAFGQCGVRIVYLTEAMANDRSDPGVRNRTP